MNSHDKRTFKVNSYFLNLRADGVGIDKDLAVNSRREPYSTDSFRSILTPSEAIIDNGASIGYYVLMEANVVQNGTIFAIEPVTETRKRMVENMEMNGAKNIGVYGYSIGDRNAEGEISICKESN